MENEIVFENVSFSYDGKEVFRNLNVRIPSDRHVALVGENGAGKSTFIKLLLGLYEPKQGSILVDGRPVKDRTPKERKRLFAAAFQDIPLGASSRPRARVKALMAPLEAE